MCGALACVSLVCVCVCQTSPSVWNCLEDHRHPHPLEQFIIVGWIGVSLHRFPPPSSKGCPSGGHILFLLFLRRNRTGGVPRDFMVLSRSYSLYLWCKYYLSSHCVFEITQRLLVCLGGAYRESIGAYFSLYKRFLIFWYSYFIFVIFILDIIAHRLLLGAYSVCVHHNSVLCVSFHLIRSEGSIFGGPSIFWGP